MPGPHTVFQLSAEYDRRQARILEDLFTLLRFPTISAESGSAPAMTACADWLISDLKSAGFTSERWETSGYPTVFAEWKEAGSSKPTILFYGHYDVQPVDPVDLWTSPPFEPTIRGENLYARGSAVDKGQVFIHLKSIEAFMKVNGSLPVNLKIIVEGEEEIGSDHLQGFVEDQKQLLKADLVLISDTSMFARGVPSVCYGLRGLSYMQIEITGPNKDLHSGSFGGSVHNPIQALAEIIA